MAFEISVKVSEDVEEEMKLLGEYPNGPAGAFIGVVVGLIMPIVILGLISLNSFILGFGWYTPTERFIAASYEFSVIICAIVGYIAGTWL